MPLPDKLNEAPRWLLGNGLPYGLAIAGALVVLWIAWRLLQRRKQTPPRLAPDLRIDVPSLGENGPPPGRPVLELYNLPVRLAAVVLAPVGLERELPPDDQLGPYFDSIVPGLDQVVRRHKPLVRRWPNQVSTRGFANLFFGNVRLPGTFGKGTPWSSVAGMFRVEDQPVMAGLILCALRPNSLSQTTVASEHQWLGCLRVRWS
jgi:hypothetical protein